MPLAAISEQLADLAQTSGQHIVRVEGRNHLASSGIVWSREGLIVTSNYALHFDEEIFIGLPNGDRVPATLIGRDPGTDVALLEVAVNDDEDEALTPPAWTTTQGTRLGHMILVLARPGRTLRCSSGIISTLSGQWRTPYGGILNRYVQTDAITRAGFSGGLVVDVAGRTVGMITSGLLDRDHIIVPTTTLGAAIVRILEGEDGTDSEGDEDSEQASSMTHQGGALYSPAHTGEHDVLSAEDLKAAAAHAQEEAARQKKAAAKATADAEEDISSEGQDEEA